MIRKIPKRSIIIPPGEIRSLLSAARGGLESGKAIAEFEGCFKEYVGAKEAVALSSGRFALFLILKHLGVKKGDKIIISSYNFPGVPRMLIDEGFMPQFVDADKDNYQICIKEVERQIDNGTKAIIVTHLFGNVCDMEKITDIARRRGVFVIEDCAHALGSLYCNKHVGSIGDAGFFSFTGSKMLNTSFGGMLVTGNRELAVKIRKDLAGFGLPNPEEIITQRLITYFYALYSNKYFYSSIFYPVSVLINLLNLDPLELYKGVKKKEIAEKKMRFSGLQALIGLNSMKIIGGMIAKRKEAVRSLVGNLDPEISIPKMHSDSEPCYILFPLKVKDKYQVFKRLLLRGIDTNLSYASDCSGALSAAPSPNAAFLSKSILTMNLPFDLEEGHIKNIAGILNEHKHLFC